MSPQSPAGKPADAVTKTKRTFIKGAASAIGLALGGALAGCGGKTDSAAAPAAGVSEKWDSEADVVVVGGGGSGLAAAIEAGKARAKVIVLEKMSFVGGDTMRNGGIMGGYGTRLAKSKGIDVSAEQVWQQFLSVPPTYGQINLEVAKIVSDRSGETIDWLESLGVPFMDQVGPDPNYTALPVIHLVQGGGSGYIKPLQIAAEKSGATFMLDTRVNGLLTATDGRVIGVAASVKGKLLRIKARRAVVLATGGYAGNIAMMEAFNPGARGLGFVCSEGTTGDGIVMASGLGAITSRTSQGPLVFPTVEVETNTIVEWHVIQGGGIAVGEEGSRFLNEDLKYMSGDLSNAIMAQIAKQKNNHVWMVLKDSSQLKHQMEIFNPRMAKADTIEALAPLAGLDAAKLKATVDRYNGFCAKKRDPDFGRQADLLPLRDGPFYAVKVKPTAVLTTGGLKGDVHARVLRFRGVGKQGDLLDAIPGLYAAGLTAEWNTVGGWTVSSCFTLGRIAGQNAAAEKAWG